MKRIEVLEDLPISYRGIFSKSYDGSASPRQAIKAMCLHCIGYERKEITECTNQGCPLWEYRPYQSQSGREDEVGVLEAVSRG